MIQQEAELGGSVDRRSRIMALSVATQEAVWLRHLQEELAVTETGPTLI